MMGLPGAGTVFWISVGDSGAMRARKSTPAVFCQRETPLIPPLVKGGWGGFVP